MFANASHISTGRNAFCSTAFLSHQTEVEQVSNFACAADASEDWYYGFTAISPLEDETTSTSTTSSTSTEASSSDGPATTQPSTSTESLSQTSTTNVSRRCQCAGHKRKHHHQYGAIVGGAVGGPVILCGSAIAIIWLIRRSKMADAAKSSSYGSSITGTYPQFKP
ncbi:hypothetical protein N657DRAFT_633390 [Parathielavia appendiculata]|uniref:Mid2 domain-containing protein n=1 Tax=Parathielavia appendiculata TaxID=2587402 RepID=A0AAN6U1J6_9PEZI|nr:hypothetical protein N657DRAFT_633390 [Parathielavia appendiculata]